MLLLDLLGGNLVVLLRVPHEGVLLLLELLKADSQVDWLIRRECIEVIA